MKQRIWIALASVALLVIAGSASYVLLSRNSPSTAPPGGAVPTCAPTGTSHPPASNQTEGNWTTYHGDATRTGYLPSVPITSAQPRWTNPAVLDADVYAEPLVCGNVAYVATENNSVYEINASTGSTIWRTNLGAPVPGSALPCGDIDPSGITGTPVLDLATQTLYAVAFFNPPHHVLFGLDLRTGAIRSQTSADPPGALPDVEQQRGALALADGSVYIPYGGLDGDCGAYHGWVVGVPTNGFGGLFSYQVPTSREGGIWATAGIAVAPDGDLFVATGNSEATTTFDYGDAVIELSPQLQVLGYFAPTDWAQLNSGDIDLGSSAPAILADGDVFQIGKAGVGYLLSGTALGGVGGQIFNATVCGGGSFGGTAQVPGAILVPCTDGLYDLSVQATAFSRGWSATGFDAGPPIVTGDVVWTVDLNGATLLGFDLTTGLQLFSFPLGAVDHFITPSAAPGAVFVAGGDQLVAFEVV